MAIDLTNEFCRTIQKKLNSVIRSGDIGPDQGTLAYLMSTENRNGNLFKADLDTNDGKSHTGQLRFMQRGTKAEYDATINGNVCEPGGTKKYFKQPYSINQVFPSVKRTFDYDEMRNFCEGKNQHIAEVMANDMHAFRSALNRVIVRRLIAGNFVGSFADGIAGPKALPLFMTTDNRINPVGEITVEQDMTNAELSGVRPRLIGANLLQSYMAMKKIQCCNTNGGYNAGELNDIDGFFLDKTYDSELGAPSNVFAFMPGAIQLLTYAKNAGEFKITDPQHTATTIADPLIPGLVYDLYTHLLYCDEDGNDDVKYVIQFKLRWDLWGLPADMFAADDNLSGVKDLFWYRALCSDDNVCALAAATPGAQPAPVASFTEVRVGDDVTYDSSASTTPVGTTLIKMTWEFGGAVGTISGAPGATITGVTGVTGTYAIPVVDTTLTTVGPNTCLEVQDDDLVTSIAFCKPNI